MLWMNLGHVATCYVCPRRTVNLALACQEAMIPHTLCLSVFPIRGCSWFYSAALIEPACAVAGLPV